MSVSIHQIIAAICPDVFCEPSARREVKRILRDGTQAGDRCTWLKAAQAARPREPAGTDLERLQDMSPFDLPGLQDPVERHTLVYDALGDSLERIYFKLLDLLERQLGWQVIKLVDLVDATPGSTLAQQWGQRSSRAIDETLKLFHSAQEHTQRLLAPLEELERLREQVRLVDDFRSSDPARRNTATEALKREWLARDWNPDGHAKQSDVGDDTAFRAWIEQRRVQLVTRSSAVTGEARAHLQTIRLYAQLLQPILGDESDSPDTPSTKPGLVSAFNTANVRVVLMAQRSDFRAEQISTGKLPKWLGKARHRPSIPTLLAEVLFRAIPEQARTGGFVFRGRAEITVTSCALRQDELELVQLVIEQAAIERLLKQLGISREADIRRILSFLEESRREPPENAPLESDVGPFQALWSAAKELVTPSEGGQRAPNLTSVPAADTTPESVLRSDASIHAREKCQWLWRELKRELKLAAL